MRIEIELPRPMTILLLVAAISGWAFALAPSSSVTTASVSSQPAVMTHESEPKTESDVAHLHEATAEPVGADPIDSMNEDDRRVLQVRTEQELLAAKEEVLRAQIEALAAERKALGSKVDPAIEEQFRQSMRLLVSLTQDQQRAEQFLLVTLSQMWEAEEKAVAIGQGTAGRIALHWPVTPTLGISAHFLDTGYEDRFKMKHYAVDIPVNQGATVRAAAGGTVIDVVDHGLGFNYIIVEHPGGYVTLYGHMLEMTVKKGQHVVAGDALGKSGGRPGTPGAGFSTGPHLHFGLYTEGKAIDPLPYLPKL